MAAKKTTTEKVQTVVLTIEATYVLRGTECLKPGCFENGAEMFPIETIDLNVCPNADDVHIKKVKVFEMDEKK